MFIAALKYSTNGVRRSGIQLDLQLASTFPLLRTPPEGFWSSSYKHATPNGVKPVMLFFTAYAVDGILDFWGNLPAIPLLQITPASLSE
jgi:hypothetical protein